MDVQDGFILGVYNYCDRWCETCRFTSRCRVFAGGAEHEAITDPELKATKLEDVPEPPPMPARLMRVVALSRAYCDHTWAVLESEERIKPRPNDDPYSIILWFAPLIASTTHRALSGLNEFDGCRNYPPDHEGSAKVALIGIDRSMMAWSDAREMGRVSADDASRLIAELHRLSFELEELIPKAREFVRPGFDEVEEVRRLEATD